MDNTQKSHTLFGGKIINVEFEPVEDATAPDGVRLTPPREIKVRQIKLKDYEDGKRHLAANELEFAAFLVGQPLTFITGQPAKRDAGGKELEPEIPAITPDSYERILAAGKEVNGAGFFIFFQRRMEFEREEMKSYANIVAALPPETIKLAVEAGRSISPTSSPKPPLGRR